MDSATLLAQRQALMTSGVEAMMANQLDYADMLFRAALTRIEVSEALNHVDIAEILIHLGSIETKRGLDASAESLYKFASFVYANALGKDSANSRLANQRAGEACWRQGKFSEARALWIERIPKKRYLPAIFASTQLSVVT